MTIRVDWRVSCSLVGTILKWLSVPLLIPLALAVYDDAAAVPFLVTIGVTIVVGSLLERLSDERDLGHREAFLMVALTWLAVALVGAIPFVVAGQGALAHPVNALFESMSGITTTGATVIVDFSVHSRATLLWRQLIQWLGGLGILILATAILSQLGVAGAQLMETETQMQNVNRLTPKISHTARLIWGLYVGLTVLLVVILYLLHLLGVAPNMTLFDAVAHALTTLSTSGFSPRPASLGAFSPIVQWTVAGFMALGATSFVLIYLVLQGNVGRLAESDEFRFYLGVLTFFSFSVIVILLSDGTFAGDIERTLRHGVFQVVSITTTTGYASTDFTLWSSSAKHLLFICMFIGGMAGSTTCSIKALRWLIVVKGFRRDLFVASHPSVVRPVRLSGEVVDEQTVRDIYAYTLISLVFFIVTTVFLVFDSARAGFELGEFEAMGAAAATFFNIGPGFGVAGPFETYAVFPETTKVAMIVLMWVGRIEIIPVLVLLTPSYWRS
ncbi:trk system potassium uptake protein TrkH [Natronoarchaeum philippinense]|uniref:Trk system potassium uptake protein TrkH n=1 Tax=Natronoarchaeum philippinense TaxID=558529 RepID=A0A285N693_NATPI|nr:TrkH family potassium uptake protein [Natronoarchaeum philippinense]SNZ04463.1 trk system potassium uptake protein TrkH [Natronoarchaeum philippinense]